ncbi:MAG: low temperature requirement protein A [Geminicoccaceae bacterium]
MAASITAIDGKGWTFFALAFAANRALIAFLYHRAKRVGAESTSLGGEMVRNFGALAVLFTITAFLPRPLACWIFGGGVLAIQLLYMLPGIRVLRFERFVPRIGHMSERFALLTLIVLGEGFFKLIVTLSEKGVYTASPDVLFNFTPGWHCDLRSVLDLFRLRRQWQAEGPTNLDFGDLVASPSPLDALRHHDRRGADRRGQGRIL